MMAGEDLALASVVDAGAREVVLLARVWTEKITLDHPEIADHLDAVLETVTRPDHVEPDVLPGEDAVLPAQRRSQSLAVVSYEQEPARIITALANRKDPTRWKP